MFIYMSPRWVEIDWNFHTLLQRSKFKRDEISNGLDGHF